MGSSTGTQASNQYCVDVGDVHYCQVDSPFHVSQIGICREEYWYNEVTSERNIGLYLSGWRFENDAEGRMEFFGNSANIILPASSLDHLRIAGYSWEDLLDIHDAQPIIRIENEQATA